MIYELAQVNYFEVIATRAVEHSEREWSTAACFHFLLLTFKSYPQKNIGFPVRKWRTV